jgi:uncharacterized protein (TIGR02001 family)
MKSLKLSMLVAAATVAMGGVALADDTSGAKVTFNVGAASDYVFRGVSQTNENAEIFGGVDLTVDKFYAGLWTSNVNFFPGDPTDAEIDVYAGFKPTLGPVSLDLGAIYYTYVNPPKGGGYPYAELKAAGSIPLGKASLGAAFFYSPDFFGPTDNDKAYYYEVNGSMPVIDKVSVSGAFGHQQLSKGQLDYNTWNLGLGYAFNDHIGVDVRYWDTDEHKALGKTGDSRGVVSLKATF